MSYVFICQPDSELLSNSMKVSRGGIIMKSHCCDADTYNRKVGLFLRNARVSFIMQSTVNRAHLGEPSSIGILCYLLTQITAS